MGNSSTKEDDVKWCVRVIDAKYEGYKTLAEGEVPPADNPLLFDTYMPRNDLDITQYNIISVGVSDVAVILHCHRKGM